MSPASPPALTTFSCVVPTRGAFGAFATTAGAGTGAGAAGGAFAGVAPGTKSSRKSRTSSKNINIYQHILIIYQ